MSGWRVVSKNVTVIKQFEYNKTDGIKVKNYQTIRKPNYTPVKKRRWNKFWQTNAAKTRKSKLKLEVYSCWPQRTITLSFTLVWKAMSKMTISNALPLIPSFNLKNNTSNRKGFSKFTKCHAWPVHGKACHSSWWPSGLKHTLNTLILLREIKWHILHIFWPE